MKCPTCGKQVESKESPSRPFCSERCKLVDLSKWVSEEYRVPGREAVPEAGLDDQQLPNARLLEEFRLIYEVFNNVGWMLLRHKSVGRFRSLAAMQRPPAS